MNVCSIVQRNGRIDLQSILEVYFYIRIHMKILFQHIKINCIFISVITGKKRYKRSVAKIVDFFFFFSSTTIDLFVVKKNFIDI